MVQNKKMGIKYSKLTGTLRAGADSIFSLVFSMGRMDTKLLVPEDKLACINCYCLVKTNAGGIS